MESEWVPVLCWASDSQKRNSATRREREQVDEPPPPPNAGGEEVFKYQKYSDLTKSQH